MSRGDFRPHHTPVFGGSEERTETEIDNISLRGRGSSFMLYSSYKKG